MAEWKALGEWPEFAGAVPPPSPGFPGGSAEQPPLPSWERGASFAHFFATIREVALDPVRTFDGMREGGFSRPISFTYASLFPAWLCGSALYGGLIFFMASLASHDGGTGLNNDPAAKLINDMGPAVAAAAAALPGAADDAVLAVEVEVGQAGHVLDPHLDVRRVAAGGAGDARTARQGRCRRRGRRGCRAWSGCPSSCGR